MTTNNTKRALQGVLPYIIGICAQLMLLIAPIALHSAARWSVVGILTALLVYIKLNSTWKQSLLFMAVMAFCSWQLGITEDRMLIIELLLAGLTVILCIQYVPGTWWFSVAVGAIAGMLVMLLWTFVTVMIERTAAGIVAALRIGFVAAWPAGVAMLIGAEAGSFLSQRL